MSDPRLPVRKRTRLDLRVYAIPGLVCSVTIGTRGRRPVFAEAGAAAAAVDVLRAHAAATTVAVHGYCVMPEHAHLVLSPSAGCDVITFVGQWKCLAQRAAWGTGIRGRIWQRGFYDHVLRADEAVERVVEYVVENPVRRGLVECPSDYPYSGSLVYELWPARRKPSP